MPEKLTNRISVKITLALIVVLVIISVIFTAVLVQNRSAALKDLMLTKARTLTQIGAKSMSQLLEEALASGRLSMQELFDTDYQRITEGPLAEATVSRFHTDYDRYIDGQARPILDSFLEEDDMVVFATLVDRNGYAPTHNTRFSQALTGDPERDKLLNRTKMKFNDPVGLRAARYEGSGGEGVLRQVYQRDTGETLWDLAAPIHVKGRHWGAFRLGFSIEETEAEIAALRNTVALFMLIVLVASSLTIYLVVVRITRPLKRLTLVADRVAEGHLDETIDIDSNDEIGRLATAFNKMTQVIVKNLRSEIDRSSRLIQSVKEAVLQLSSATNEIMAISAQQSSGASQQASAVQEATTTSEEIAVTAKQVAENARQVEAMAEQASAASGKGMHAVNNATEGMTQLKDQVQSMADAMLDLGENSQKIGGIVDIIDEISEQTNLLALNAAIEAAGAGEAGKRFSVVANEVKRLAERTVDATRQIKGLIDQIQKSTNATIMLTEEGTKAVDGAHGRVGRIAEALNNISATVEETTRASREIKISTHQQTSASEQMAETIAEVRDVAAQVATSAHETAQSIAELNALAERLRVLTEEEG